MKVTGVTFGQITAVSGKPRRIKYLNRQLDECVQNGSLMRKDVTSKYVNASLSGMMAKAATGGDKVMVYITGDDMEKVKLRVPQWDSIEGILSNITSYVDLNKYNLFDLVEKIKNS